MPLEVEALGSPKVPSGIPGLDAVLRGGLPHGRTTIVVGGPGSGKTVLAMQFLVNGAAEFDEPGLMITFEESPAALARNFPSGSWSMAELLGNGGIEILDGRLPEEAVEAGEFDLGGLIAVGSSIIEKRGIKRIAIDGIDALFAISEERSTRRREIIRVINWLTDLGLSAVLTVKANGEERLPRGFDLAEYAADAVIRLQATLLGELSRRTLSVVKMRGATFLGGAHAYTISRFGMRVLATPLQTDDAVQSLEVRLSSGVDRLDRMLLGGFRQGTTTLLSGLPGTSKTTLSMAFLKAGALAGERVLFIGFDEPASQVLFDARSVGIDVEDDMRAGLFVAKSYSAGSVIGDNHYLAVEHIVDTHRPTRVVIDPISALEKAGGREVADAVTERLVGLMKERDITAIFTAVVASTSGEVEATPTRVSTIADTWIHLSFANRGGERNRTLTIVKSRGTAHSNQMRELLLSSEGIELADVYSSGGDVLVGTARAEREQQEAAERAAEERGFAQELFSIDREGEGLERTLRDAQRRLEELQEHRAKLVRRTAASGPAHERETDAIRVLRHGDTAS